MFFRNVWMAAAAAALMLSLGSAAAVSQEVNRSPREAAEQGLRWIGLLEPLFAGCQLSTTLTAPFIDLANLMASNAQARGFATAAETAKWRAEGAAEGRKRLLGMSTGAGLSSATCSAVVSELTAQRDAVAATVQQLRNYQAQHPAGKH